MGVSCPARAASGTCSTRNKMPVWRLCENRLRHSLALVFARPSVGQMRRFSAEEGARHGNTTGRVPGHAAPGMPDNRVLLIKVYLPSKTLVRRYKLNIIASYNSPAVLPCRRAPGLPPRPLFPADCGAAAHLTFSKTTTRCRSKTSFSSGFSLSTFLCA